MENNVNLFNLTEKELELFLMILFRSTGIIIFVPLFGNRNLPAMIKIGLGFMISLIIYSLFKYPDFKTMTEITSLFSGLIKELTIGLIIGLAAKFIFTGIQMAGEFMGFQMGFGIVSVIDPFSANQVSIITQFQDLISLLFFLTIDGHHIFLRAIWNSFINIPIASPKYNIILSTHIINLFGQIFIIGLKLAAPVLGALFLTNVALMLIARTVPQMNVFIVGFPLTISIGLITIIICMTLYFSKMNQYFNSLSGILDRLIRSMGYAVG